MKKSELVRKNIRMSPEIADWYVKKADELGVSQTNLMVMALYDYIKEDKAVDMMSNFQFVMSQLEQLTNDTEPLKE